MSLLPREWQSLSPRNRKRAIQRLRFLRLTQLAVRVNLLPIAYLAAAAALAIGIHALLPPHPLAPVLAVGATAAIVVTTVSAMQIFARFYQGARIRSA